MSSVNEVAYVTGNQVTRVTRSDLFCNVVRVIFISRTYILTDIHIYRHMDIQTNRHTKTQTDIKITTQKEKKRCKQNYQDSWKNLLVAVSK